MFEPLTIRIEQNQIVISYDDGLSFLIEDLDKLSQIINSITSLHEGLQPSFKSPSASTLGMLSESKLIEALPAEVSVPASCDYGDGKRLPLAPEVLSNSRTLKEILQDRLSRRDFKSIALDELATILVRSSRVIDIKTSDDGYQITHRPTPSAGARHPIELKVITFNVHNIETSLWAFDPAMCELVKTPCEAAEISYLENVVKDVGNFKSTPAAVIFLVAHFPRTLSRYPNGSSLVWRDAGVFVSTLHLCATDIGLASCILGTCQLLTEPEDELITDVCAIAIGGIAST